MPSQSDFEKVKRTIIDPMTRHWGADFDADMQADFVDDLTRFSEDTLDKAMQNLRSEQKRKPTLAHVVEACKIASKVRTSGNITNLLEGTHPWVERERKRHELVDEYLKHFFLVSTIAREAERDGWDTNLLNFVKAVAWVQAQMIIPGGSGVGWDGFIIFGESVTESIRAHFFKDQKRLCTSGSIDVAIPTNRIEDWKSRAAWRKKYQRPETPMAASLAPIMPTALDLEIQRQLG